MTIGLHPRLSGKPERCLMLKHFLEHVTQYQDVWIARRIDIAQFWLEKSPLNNELMLCFFQNRHNHLAMFSPAFL